MYRMNAQSRAIEEKFLTYGIRYQIVGGTRFYQRREVKDALAYLRVLRSDTDVVSFERIINVPARGIGDKSVEALRRWAVAHEDNTYAAVQAAAAGEVEGLAPRIRTAMGEFARLLIRAPHADRRAAAARAARRGPRGVGLPGDARRRLRGGRGPLGEPARAAPGDDPLRRPVARRRARPAARGDRAGRRPGRLRGRRRRRHADHAPRGQGPRVPGRVHRRARGGAVPAQPGPRRREGAGGGAAARVRRDHAREAAAVPLARLAAGDVGRRRHERPVAVPAGDPGRADGRAAAPPAGPTTGSTSTRTSCSGTGGRGSGQAIRSGGGAYREGSGRPGAPAAGRGVPPVAGPRREARGVRGRRAVRVARAAAAGHRRASPRGPSSPASAATATATRSTTPAGATAS